MKLLLFAKYSLIFLIPIIIIILALDFAAFDYSFYLEKFLQYNVENNVKDPNSLNRNVLDYISGNTNSISNSFNSREKEHLDDVRSLVNVLTFVLYALLVLFGFFLVFAAINLKINNAITNFFGKVMIYGGLLTILVSLIIILSFNSNFAGTFSTFHKAFFEEGTYSFDPATEIIVNLYPEELFRDIGIKISRNVFLASIILIVIGSFLLLSSKRTKK